MLSAQRELTKALRPAKDPAAETPPTATFMNRWIFTTSRLDHQFGLVNLIFCYRVGCHFCDANGPTLA